MINGLVEPAIGKCGRPGHNPGNQSQMRMNRELFFFQARVPGPSVSSSGKHVVDPVEPWRASPAAALTWRDSPSILGEESHYAAPCRDRGTNLQGPVKEKSPLRQLEIRINQASRRKSDLQQLAQEIGLEITGNETIAVLKVRSMDQASRLTPGHFLDPVGFGKYSDKTYGEVMAMDSQYCQWVLVTAKEGESCARLQRLAFWLQEHKNNDAPMIPAAKTSNKQKKVGTAQGSKMEIKTNEEIVSQGASSSNAEMQQSIQQLMGAVKSLATELESVRQENKESKRRVHHSEDVTTSNSEWEGVSQA